MVTCDYECYPGSFVEQGKGHGDPLRGGFGTVTDWSYEQLTLTQQCMPCEVKMRGGY